MKTLKLDDIEFSVLYGLVQDVVFDMEEDVRMTMLDIIKENLPMIREKFNEFVTARDKDYQGKSGW